jgi:hypothetical protein
MRDDGGNVMTQMIETTIARYMNTFDRAAHDPGALEELLTLFAPAATVQLRDDQEPVTGIAALRELYRGVVGHTAESRHVWTTAVLDDGRIETRWAQASRTVDDRILAFSGIERVTLDADGLITNLRNRMVAPDNLS